MASARRPELSTVSIRSRSAVNQEASSDSSHAPRRPSTRETGASSPSTSALASASAKRSTLFSTRARLDHHAQRAMSFANTRFRQSLRYQPRSGPPENGIATDSNLSRRNTETSKARYRPSPEPGGLIPAPLQSRRARQGP